ncbi:MATE family efflux transporter [Cytobacillus oceanisediminis]|uniref:MATE family efflux transporter n=1 Tax=Cytobacillus oceanisediminis TaxID=665099 RepID=UPI003736BB6C
MAGDIRQEPLKIIKTILLLALPVVIENFFQMILGFVDTLFVSKLGLIEVSSVGVTNAILAIYLAIFMAIGISANVYVAKYSGAGNDEKVKEVTAQAIILALLSGIIFGLITLFLSDELLKLMGVEEEVLSSANSYFRIIAIPSIFISLMFVLSSVLRGKGDTKSPMKISIFINLLNLVLDYVLIFGFFLIPAFGLEGAAYATLFSRLVGSFWLVIDLRRAGLIEWRMSLWRINKKVQLEMISLSSPAAAERLAMRLGQVLYFGFIVSIGTNTFAAHQIAGNIEVFAYMIGYGFATAATILVSNHLGSGNQVDASVYAKYSLGTGTAIMSFFGLVLFFGAEWLGSFFTHDPGVLNDIRIALQIDAFIQPVLAIVLILTGVYQGAEHTKYPFYLTLAGMWLIRTGGVYVLGITLGMGIAGIWLAIGLDNLYRAIFLIKNFKNGKWMKERSVPADDPAVS